MKNLYYIVFRVACACLPCTAIAQFPSVQWKKQFGGSATDIPYSIKATADGGTVVAGYTDSKDFDVAPHTHRDFGDLWILKLDKCGNKMWERSFGGTDYEKASDVLQTTDGGYLVLGETSSTDGDVVSGYASRDIWLLRLDAQGTLQWQKRLGGHGLDVGNAIIASPDGNFFIAASSSSNDGDITGNHGTSGYTDGALLKIDASGNLLWSKCFGGSKNDELLKLTVINNRIYLAGYANSTDGDIPPTQKNYDVWLLTTDLNGTKISSYVYGGSQNDVAYAMTVGNDGTLTLAGYTTSSDGVVTGAKGSQDFWILNVDLQGKLRWQHALGGSDAEFAYSAVTDSDGGYIVGGVSYSSDQDVTNAKGGADYWIVKMDSHGKLLWTKSLGGKGDDDLRSILFSPDKKEYYFAGDTQSTDDDFTDPKGDADYGIVKCKEFDTLFTDTVVCPGATFTQRVDTLKDVCGYDSAVATYRLLTTNCESSHLIQTDTIYVPNAFTPNGDGRNDEFGAAGKISGNFFMQVFNRYGELIFQSNDISYRWNGRYKSQLQTTGTFVYAIRYTNTRKQAVIRRGSFMLIR